MADLSHPGVLSDGAIELRRWREGDAPVVQSALPGTESDAMDWVRRQMGRPPEVGVSCAIALPDEPAVGYVGLIRRPRVELGATPGADEAALVFRGHRAIAGIGYWVAPGDQGHGYATRAAVLLTRWALGPAGLIRVEALLDPENVASRRVVEKSGFEPEGRLRRSLELDGHSVDALVYSLLATDL